ncbi:helix-turn-helix domain-containing protein [Sphingobacterium bambusae]|uniref:Helix-turn-helix domain-containing protein n=1 Tax=Sphingobacterium bambusae TaxID=662858 RepID=A0ABW6BM05_9SPHI|nr:helix-turn-helix transcriptional regulator [Sphingobacterium bambusae]WPL49452.1 helix-turn-helix transcriptional regulator [Sphingobacterium bambusae]
MNNTTPTKIKSISEYHRLRGLPQPEHPLISVVNYADMQFTTDENPAGYVFEHYSIALKRGVGKLFYGQQKYDFDEGVMYFMAPNQVLKVYNNPGDRTLRSGWLLLVHPDFLWNTPLAKKIKQYDHFDYSVHEALFLSEKEEAVLNNIVQNIKQEYHGNTDKFSRDIIISQIETLLNYSERFYQRQFITREISNHQLLERLEELLNDYFNKDELITKGLPTVQFVSESLNISASYLSRMLKTLTGSSTQQHIREKLIEKAKEKLSTTKLSVSEIAYELGFEHPQSFSKLFKLKTKQSPLEFRACFN